MFLFFVCFLLWFFALLFVCFLFCFLFCFLGAGGGGKLPPTSITNHKRTAASDPLDLENVTSR
jgi:hypothetical protein